MGAVTIRKKLIYIFIFFLIFFILVLGYGIVLIHTMEKRIIKETEILITEEISDIFENLENQMKSIAKDKNIAEFIKANEPWKWFFTKKLELIVTKNIKRVYMVAQDDKGNFEIIISTEKDTNGEKIKSEKLIDVIKKGKSEIIYNKNGKRWITLAKPVIQNGNVTAILLADFSVKKFEKIQEMITGIRWIILGTTFLISIFLLILLYNYIYNSLIEKRLYTDKLTGLYSTSYVNDVLRFSGLKNYAMLIVDIDDFRMINQTYGKEVGDKVIKAVAGQIKRLIKIDSDIIVRYGGEEFLLLIKLEKPEDNTGLTVAKRIYSVFKNKPINIDKRYNIGITVSISVIPNISIFRNLEEAIRVADKILYEAKSKGKNRIEIYTEKASGETIKTIDEVKEALSKERIIFHYQPIFDLKTMKIVMFEALVRMKNTEGNIIFPQKFLPIIKGTSLYIEMSKFGIIKNVNILKKNRNIKISMNFGISDILNNSLFNFLLNTIDEDIGRRFCIELLEDEEISDYKLLKKRIEKLKKKGVKFKVDDFGAGYANFVRLSNLNIDYVKIDGSIVKSAVNDKKSFELLKAMVSFCKGVGIKTTAEFIDSEDVLKKVKEAGVDHGQGYYLSKPKAPEELGWHI